MLEISELKLPCGTDVRQLEKKIRKELRLKAEPYSWEIVRHSVDARKKPELYDVYTVRVSLADGENMAGGPTPCHSAEEKLAAKLRNRRVRFVQPAVYRFPECDMARPRLKHRPVVIGSGPAGLFCALMLAEQGYRPIVLERGRRMEERVRDVEHFFAASELDPSSNVQFGEGGAGTFSDGKLTTNVRDRFGRNARVLEEFVAAGAPEEILCEFHPHIGTDRLRTAVVALRNKLIALGGEVRFESCVRDMFVEHDTVRGLLVEGRAPEGAADGGAAAGTYFLPADAVVLAPGHSARDTIRMLLGRGAEITQKQFAVGFRVSHPQALIDARQYGISDPEEMRRLHLAAATYKLTAQMPSGRGVYSFCMCPGGWIVNASSEPGRLAVNGMSDFARDSARANSAIVLTVGREEFGSEDALAGMRFQERLEERAYQLAQGRIPVERFKEFAAGAGAKVCSDMTPEETAALCLKGRSAYAPLHTLLPRDLTEDFIGGMMEFDRTIPGFAGDDAYVCGLESRTSSPVRITRDASCESKLRGLYPCGEGAGYAGGIMSAAIDGIRVAEALAAKAGPKT